MKDRSRIALLSATAAALVLLYLTGGGISERGMDERGEERILFPHMSAENVDELILRFPVRKEKEEDNAVSYHFTKTRGRWKLMRDGQERPANETHVETLLEGLESLRTHGPAAKGRGSWERFGVAPQTGILLEIRYGGRAESGAAEDAALYIGNEVPGTKRLYLRRDGEEEVLTAAFPSVVKERELSFWADLRIFPSPPRPQEIIRLELESFRGDRVRLLKQGASEGNDRWVMEAGGRNEPVAGEEVLQLLRTFFALQADRFSADCPGSSEAVLTWTAENDYGSTYGIEVFGRSGGSGYIVCRTQLESSGAASEGAVAEDGDRAEDGTSAFVVSEEELDLLRSSLEQVLR